MRLADADVLAQGDGNIPPLEVRLDLQPGDHVGLYEEVRHASMGAGYSPIEAVVLGSPEPGWFLGETEDGREITFHAGNVADVMMASPQMGGIFDWFKSPPLPGSLIPANPQAFLPAPPPPKPEERKGLIAQLKTLFSAPFQAAPPSTSPKRSMFDIFKKPEVKPGPSGLPAQKGAQAVVPHVKKPSMFSIFSKESKIVIPFSKQVAALAVPKGPLPLAPYIKKFEEVFKVIPKSPEPVPKAPGQTQLWAGLFEEAKEGEERSFSEIFKVFPKTEIQPYEEVIPPGIPQRMHRKLKVLPMPRRMTLFPTVEDVARGLMGFYNPIEELFDSIRHKRSGNEWQEYLAKHGFSKEQWEGLGNCGGPPDLFRELSAFMHIPWEEFRNRAVIEMEGEQERWVNEAQIWIDIVFPSTELITAALELMKPADLPGRFVIEKEKEHGCQLLFTYIEGEEGSLPMNVRPEQAEESSGPVTPEQVVAQMKVDDVDPQEAMGQLENEILELIRQRDEIGPQGPGVEELMAEIEFRREIVKEIMEELSAEPEEAKPAAAKKKVSKRSGQKKG
jgi:hypothetical protein